MSISIPTGVNLRSSEWTTSILRHYDFALVAGIISYCLVSKIVIVSIKRFENQNFENSKF